MLRMLCTPKPMRRICLLYSTVFSQCTEAPRSLIVLPEDLLLSASARHTGPIGSEIHDLPKLELVSRYANLLALRAVMDSAQVIELPSAASCLKGRPGQPFLCVRSACMGGGVRDRQMVTGHD